MKLYPKAAPTGAIGSSLLSRIGLTAEQQANYS